MSRASSDPVRADGVSVTFLEQAFPYVEVSRLVLADRRARDPGYQAHKWWARRPPALVRACLLAAVLPDDTPMDEFRRMYASSAPHLSGTTVLDHFSGGGTTLLEAARLGATCDGADLDPLAVLIGQHLLTPAEPAEVLEAGGELLRHLRSHLGHLWPGGDQGWEPVHYFSVARVRCPGCTQQAPLHRSLVLARSTGKAGAVVRDAAIAAFCPECYRPQDLGAHRTTITCCGRRRSLSESTYTAFRFECPTCGLRSSHEELKTGIAPRQLVAVEESQGRPTAGSSVVERRRIRPAEVTDTSTELIESWLAQHPVDRAVLDTPLQAAPGRDRRPLSFGVSTVGSLHTPRQLAYLSAAHAWIGAQQLPAGVSRALSLAVSNTVVANNRLCGYATDYGRLAPLFSVRAFALPWLTVELNPLSRSGGRGTLASAVLRVAKSGANEVRRHVPTEAGPAARTLSLARNRTAHSLTRANATTATFGSATADLALTDPPYFDFIAYDALSQIFRAWLPDGDLTGAPLLPAGPDPVAAFGTNLGLALRKMKGRLKPEALLAFTYKGGQSAWDAIGIALDEAKLRVTALWPVLADPHMGHHSNAGNCEYDLLVVTRDYRETSASSPSTTVSEWLATLRSAKQIRPVSEADQQNMSHALRVCGSRWGTTRWSGTAG